MYVYCIATESSVCLIDFFYEWFICSFSTELAALKEILMAAFLVKCYVMKIVLRQYNAYTNQTIFVSHLLMHNFLMTGGTKILVGSRRNTKYHKSFPPFGNRVSRRKIIPGTRCSFRLFYPQSAGHESRRLSY